ncbi:MAG: double-strand break repair helicase AddA [Rhodospirillaceae bacterium]|jgi:ATP-dependent helicase/nuclease subunit A|nr:double-strand break repair helicase AddA [Rhodospirillaceae bacterium]
MNGAPESSPVLAATAAQRHASDPEASAWVAASAGSGKTKVLTDRVLSLLLDGVPPERILCLTFTRAASAEMANRINRRLGEWSILSADLLTKEIASLRDRPVNEADIAAARRLLARVLDVPGGLKIQTIHSFCQSLLGRFPIEAGLPPHFEAMDERSAAELMAAARNDLLVAARTPGPLSDALSVVTAHIEETGFTDLMSIVARDRWRIQEMFRRYHGVEGAIAETYAYLKIDPIDSAESVIAGACADGAFDAVGLKLAAAALLGGTEKTDQPKGASVSSWVSASAVERAARFDAYVSEFFTAAGDVRKTLITKKPSDAEPRAEPALRAEAERLSAVMETQRRVVTAHATAALLRLADALLSAYCREKEIRARLDYDDLILKSLDLLSESAGAAWVLFKLDGGLDHILIDEAQDTNPEQWRIVALIAEEFFAGEGARDANRTVFAVGDAKQSIFSFQRADPAAFADMRHHFQKRIEDARGTLRNVELIWSFRSAEAVLKAVDSVFEIDAARDGVADHEVRHQAVREGHAGVVELWPVVAPRDRPAALPWEPPVAREDGDNPASRLAGLLARRIKSWVGHDILESRGRPVRAGDIMVLVRRRDAFVEELVRSLKSQGVPVAGIDRMALTKQLAVMDLMALGRFLLLPEDDLTLAEVLKGPFIGLDDDDLFTLAYDRGDVNLWRRLTVLSRTGPRFAQARTWLGNLLSRIDFIPPYELFAQVLQTPNIDGETGQQRIVARLGPEAEDPVGEFMNLALQYDHLNAPSMQGFLHWLEAGEATVKRDMEQGERDEVRVITVHGAKGLQAPIVILPDTTTKPTQGPRILWPDDMLLWPPRRAYEDRLCRTARAQVDQLRDQEYRRLLYVAMTRAEDRLYVCGWQGERKLPDGCWYNLVKDGLSEISEPINDEAHEDIDAAEPGLRLSNPQSVPPKLDGTVEAALEPEAGLERWMREPPPPEPSPPRPIAPSRPSGDPPPVHSPLQADDQARFQRGLQVHRLLQTLPDIAESDRRAACARLLERSPLVEADQRTTTEEVMEILESVEFQPLFGPNSRAEVPVIGTIDRPDGPEIVSGQVDRLVIREHDVLIVDYKTNRPPPTRQSDVSPVYLRQMAAYRDILRQIWPEKDIVCALLWTDGPRIMSLGQHLLDRVSGGSIESTKAP